MQSVLSVVDHGDCAGGHHYKHMAAPQRRACAQCAKVVCAGAYLYGCVDCDHDRCTECYRGDPKSQNSTSTVAEEEGPKSQNSTSTVAEEGVRASRASVTAPTTSVTKPPAIRSTMLLAGLPMQPSAMNQNWTSVATLKIPLAIEDSRECEPGQHRLQYYPASRTVLCSMCSQQVSSGKYMYGCDECDTDLCETCFASTETSRGRGRKVTKAPKNASKQSPSKGTEVQYGSVERRRSVDSTSTASTTLSQSSSGSKECNLCGEHYSGYGIMCGVCRKFGSTVHQCTVCTQTYFKGYGTSCDECLRCAQASA
jgi:hypothetical protein